MTHAVLIYNILKSRHCLVQHCDMQYWFAIFWPSNSLTCNILTQHYDAQRFDLQLCETDPCACMCVCMYLKVSVETCNSWHYHYLALGWLVLFQIESQESCGVVINCVYECIHLLNLRNALARLILASLLWGAYRVHHSRNLIVLCRLKKLSMCDNVKYETVYDMVIP